MCFAGMDRCKRKCTDSEHDRRPEFAEWLEEAESSCTDDDEFVVDDNGRCNLIVFV